MINLIIIVFLAAFSSVCFACSTPPEEQRVNHDELISRTENIVLAKVIGAEYIQPNVNYKFRVIKNIKGNSKVNFEITGSALLQNSLHNFNHHYDDAFWEKPIGRTFNDEDCKIHPGFSVGQAFLIFLGKPYHRKSFEYIIRTHGDTKDKWLTYVERKSSNAP